MPQIKLIASGKGGVGKSTLGAYIAQKTAALGQRVLLIELDAGLRSLDLILDVSQRVVFDLSDVLGRGCDPVRAVVESEHVRGLFLLAASVDRSFVPEPSALLALCQRLCDTFDLLLLDTPAGLSPVLDAAIAASQGALLVATPDPVSVRDADSVAGLLLSSGMQDLKLILNRVPKKPKGLLLPSLDDAIDRIGVQLIGVVPEDHLLPKAGATGTPLPEDSAAGQEIARIVSRMQGRYIPLPIK